MIINITEIYENEGSNNFIIDTSLAKTKEEKIIANFLENQKDTVSVPSDVTFGMGRILNKWLVKPPIMIEKQLMVYSNDDANYSNWLKDIDFVLNVKKVNNSFLNNVFVSKLAELSDGTPMKQFMGSGVLYNAIALIDILDKNENIYAIKAGEACQVMFLGYADKNKVGLFTESPQSSSSFPMFSLLKGINNNNKTWQENMENAIFTDPPKFGVHFGIPLQNKVLLNKKPKVSI